MRIPLPHEIDGLRTFAVVLDKRDEAVAELAAFARERQGFGGSTGP